MPTTPQDADIRGIRQIHVPVRDLDRATGFYRDTLGIPHLFTVPPGMSFFQCGGIRLMLGVPGPDGLQPGCLVYYDVKDIHATFARLSERGATLPQEPHVVHRAEGLEIWLAELPDGEGNTIALMSEIAVE